MANINSQYYIGTYPGVSGLNLMSKPDGDNIFSRDYDTFIQSISSIYASQDTNTNNIPKFWTTLTTILDARGGRRTQYVPHPDSDLRTLTPDESYYFIVRNTNNIPLTIPLFGGSSVSQQQLLNLPIINLSNELENKILLRNEREYEIVIELTNLIPGVSYNYSFESVSVVGQVKNSNISGSIKPSTSTYTLKNTISFCDNNCEGPDIMASDNSSCATENKQVAMIFKIGQDVNKTVISAPMAIVCDNCIYSSIATLHSENNLIEESNIDGNLYDYNFTLQLKNLPRNRTYNYSIELIKSEWPIIFVTPTSGEIKINNADSTEIEYHMVLCADTDLCKPGLNGVSDYVVPTYSPLIEHKIDYNNILVANISSINDDGCEDIQVQSDPFTIRYKRNIENLPPISITNIGCDLERIRVCDSGPKEEIDNSTESIPE
jgi:hypothetical protein